MARIRTIKPEFWSDELVASWPMATRLAYIALWNECDDEGRLRASPVYLRSRLFPYDVDLDLEAVLAPLIESRRLIIYRAEGQTYGFLPKFREHQSINKPARSRLPPPPSEDEGGERANFGSPPVVLPESSRSPPVVLPESSRRTTGGKGKEGKGKDLDHTSSGDDVSAAGFGPDDLAAAWNELAPPECPRVRELSEKRRARARQRLRENPEPEFWTSAIEAMHHRPFLRGRGPRGWRADFDWLLQPDSATRVLEGCYADEAPEAVPRKPEDDGYRYFGGEP